MSTTRMPSLVDIATSSPSLERAGPTTSRSVPFTASAVPGTERHSPSYPSRRRSWPSSGQASAAAAIGWSNTLGAAAGGEIGSGRTELRSAASATVNGSHHGPTACLAGGGAGAIVTESVCDAVLVVDAVPVGVSVGAGSSPPRCATTTDAAPTTATTAAAVPTTARRLARRRPAWARTVRVRPPALIASVARSSTRDNPRISSSFVTTNLRSDQAVPARRYEAG